MHSPPLQQLHLQRVQSNCETRAATRLSRSHSKFQSLRQEGRFHRESLVRLALPLLSQKDKSNREIYLVSEMDDGAS
jgi:hypothetical protein